ncbi:MAG: SDR family oxidoreductase [Pyrinomonadaceae bacterium]
MNQLLDRVAIITGASAGIGQSIASAYAAEGAKVVLAARHSERLVAAADAIRVAGKTALAITTDVTSESDVANLFKRTVEAFGRVDVLVNNAGVTVSAPPDELSLEDWRKVLDVNLTGAFLCSREALRVMKPRRSGRILNIGSVSAKVPRFNSAAYVTSKFGLEGLTRSMALDAREFGIAVSILHPGNTESELWQGREEVARREGLMAAEELARVAVLMAALPPDINFLEGVVLPLSMPFWDAGKESGSLFNYSTQIDRNDDEENACRPDHRTAQSGDD